MNHSDKIIPDPLKENDINDFVTWSVNILEEIISSVI